MTSYVTPKRAAAFQFFISLTSQSNTKIFQNNPTLASGDVKVSKDGGNYANITTLPTVVNSGKVIQVDLSAAEMTADNVVVIFSDASGAEWCDLEINIPTTTRQIDELVPSLNVTTIATLASQTSFTLAAGSADDDSYNGCYAVIEDAETAVQKSVVPISDYVGSSRTVTLATAAAFTVAVGDRVTIVPINLSSTTVAGISGGGSGARTVTVTVQTSGAVAIQGAKVRLLKGAESFVQATNASGQCVFNVDDGTWTVSITANGYSFAGASLVVDGTETPTYTMTTNSVNAPAAPNLSVLTGLCLGTNGLVESGVVVKFRMVDGPGTAGYVLDSGEFSLTSNASGVMKDASNNDGQFVIGATYKARRGTSGEEVEKVIPNAASFEWPEILGAP